LKKNRNALVSWISCYNHYYDLGYEAILTKFDPQFASFEDYHPPEWHELSLRKKIRFYVKKYEVLRKVAAELHALIYAMEQGVEQYLIDNNIAKVTQSMDQARQLSEEYVTRVLAELEVTSTTPTITKK